MSRADRETGCIRWPKDATERALIAVLANWHIAGCLLELRRAA